MNKQLQTNVFVTDQDAVQVDALIRVGVELMHPDKDHRTGVVAWSKVVEACGEDIGYARGWLIIRRAYLEQKESSLLVPAAEMVEAARAKAIEQNRLAEFDASRMVLAPVIEDLKDTKQLSWGEIMCRTGLNEGVCRKAYRATGAKKDKGIRNGRGGKFAYGDPTLYLDNRKAEGAHIPADYVGRPIPEKLLNFVAKDAPKPTAKPKAPRKPAAKKVPAA